ncbi:uncharacterized protein LOC124140738 [Haliotis rufescens]|uniref:uncharacterized protein LOC124140738 n=1 Tax=Haliotis rufescens TaxID=6454 RepID=UPI001EB05E72|nr:uncharacterized protein LOC124140738 [Haliotis rufescens]
MAAERGKMPAADEKCIQTHIMDIEVELDAKDITGTLYSKNVIDLDDMKHIDAGTTRVERTNRFLDILMSRGTEAFPVFLHGLEVMGYKDLHMKLTATKDSIKPIIKQPSEAQFRSQFRVLHQYIERVVAEVDTRASKMDLIFESKRKYATKEELKVLRKDLATKEELIAFRDEIARSAANVTETLNNIYKMFEENVDQQTLKGQNVGKDDLVATAQTHTDELREKVSCLAEASRKLEKIVNRHDINDLK